MVEEDETNENELGKKLIQLNVKALCSRYKDDSNKELMKHYDQVIKKYSYNYIMPNCKAQYSENKYQMIKSVDCFLYQCSEGNIPKTKLYKKVQKKLDNFKNWMLDIQPEYEKAKWDLN